MEKKTKHFDMRMTPTDQRLLKRLAKQAGVTQTQYIVNYVRLQAKLAGFTK